MNSLDELYNQYSQLKENLQDSIADGLTTDLLQYGIKRDYYEQVDKATGVLIEFYHKYLTTSDVWSKIVGKLHDERGENVKFCLLVDVTNCYEGLDHPTSFTTPEDIALMILLGKVFGIGEIHSYEQLANVSSATLSLIDLIPYIGGLSDELGNRYSLFLSPILQDISSHTDRLYRVLLYNMCKRIAEVDGEISLSEKEWLNEIALLNDDDPANDIDVSNI